MEEEEKAFRVRDRRIHHDEEGAPAAEPATPGKGAPERPEGDAVPAPGASALADAREGGEDAAHGFSMAGERPPIDFSAFVFSLARTALIHMGMEKHPETGRQDANLEAARETIDVLAMLEEKTRGNLTPEEAELITKMLYTLRMSYVEVARAASPG